MKMLVHLVVWSDPPAFPKAPYLKRLLPPTFKERHQEKLQIREKKEIPGLCTISSFVSTVSPSSLFLIKVIK